MKVAIYCRLSEEDRNKPCETEDSSSIQNQKAMLLQYVMEHGWELYNVYSDDDYTGADRGRPAFNRLLKDAEEHRFDIILCKTQSRFTRELEMVEKYIHGLFPIWGIRFISIVDHADTANKGNKKSRQINGLVNEWYLEDMSDNIRSVLTNRRMNGYHIGAFALYGYRKSPDEKGKLLIDEEAAAVVREVFIRFSQGYGKTAIARMLNDRGIPNPTEYKRLHGLRYQQPKSSNSTLWKYFAISSMLTNEMYIGHMVQGKYGSASYKTRQNRPRPKSQWLVVRNTHEPIIDRELWERVQMMIAEKTKPFSAGTIGLFARKARCMSCGCTMRSTKNKGKSYLKCANRHVSQKGCQGAFISVDRLEKMVLDELNGLSAEYVDQDELEKKVEFSSDLEGEMERLRTELSTYEKRMAEYAKGIRELYMDKVKGLISESDYREMSKEFHTERERMERLIRDGEKKCAELDEKVAAEDHQRKWIERYFHLEHLSREIVETMIDFILIGRRIPGTRDVPIEIHWNF